jgi:hypothetical protein
MENASVAYSTGVAQSQTPVISIKYGLLLSMGMPTYRVTEEKLREHFGQELEQALHPLKNRVYQLLAGYLLLCVFVVLWALYIFSPIRRWSPFLTMIFSPILLIGLIAWFYFMFRTVRFIHTHAMKDLVNDKELLWLNSQGIHDTVKKWSSTRDGGTNETSFKILSYLKKRGTAQGLHTTVKSLQDSGSANTQLKRMSGIRRDTKLPLGPLVENVGNDYHYLPWQFKIVDRNNKPVTTPEAAKMERLLIQCWESMIDGNL